MDVEDFDFSVFPWVSPCDPYIAIADAIQDWLDDCINPKAVCGKAEPNSEQRICPEIWATDIGDALEGVVLYLEYLRYDSLSRRVERRIEDVHTALRAYHSRDHETTSKGAIDDHFDAVVSRLINLLLILSCLVPYIPPGTSPSSREHAESKADPPTPLDLTPREAEIIAALGMSRMTGDQIAAAIHRRNSGSIKGRLSIMVEKRLLDNSRARRGYEVTDLGRASHQAFTQQD